MQFENNSRIQRGPATTEKKGDTPNLTLAVFLRVFIMRML